LRCALETRVGHTVSHEWFRANFPRYVDRAVLEAATSAARHQADDVADRVALLDSHAVAPTEFGLRCMPDSPARTKALDLAGIVHFTFNSARDRVLHNSGKEGRHPLTAPTAEEAEYAQVATVVAYASINDCVLMMVNAEGDVPTVGARLETAVAALVSR
jgi:hypothetical protein